MTKNSSVVEVTFKNFAKFTGKHLCWSLSFNKIAVSLLIKLLGSACNFIKKKSPTQVLSSKFCKDCYVTEPSANVFSSFVSHHRICSSGMLKID